MTQNKSKMPSTNCSIKVMSLDEFKLNLFSEEIYIFTPKGDLRVLPIGATTLDFAYDIHTDIGDSCIGAKVNNRLVPLSHQLDSGD